MTAESSISIDDLNALFSGKRVIVSSRQGSVWVPDIEGTCQGFVRPASGHQCVQILVAGRLLGFVPDTITVNSAEGPRASYEGTFKNRRKVELR